MVVFETSYSLSEECEIYNQLTRNELDAIIITHTLLEEDELKERVRDKVAVVCNEPLKTKKFDVFSLDEDEAVYSATRYLLKKGLSHLLFCADDERTQLQKQRWEGFVRAHRDLNITITKDQKISGYSSIEDGILLGDEIFSEQSRYDGIISGSDFLAAGIVTSAIKHNVLLNENLFIIGFDNHPICLTTSPALSSIENQTDKMVKDVVACLLDRLAGHEFSTIRKVYKGELIIRGS
ncbi:substrate-binding domain-containing protein [Bacillus sp. F19]|nr:substrate-binding domain-containing protein [Bacillus sp. F19]